MPAQATIHSQTFEVGDKFSLYLAPIFELEFLISEKEYDHVTKVTKITNYCSGTTSYNHAPADYSTFDALKLKPIHLSFGLNFGPKYSFAAFFIDIPFTLGFSFFPQSRTQNLYSEVPSEPTLILGGKLAFAFEYGIRIGYTFKNPGQESSLGPL